MCVRACMYVWGRLKRSARAVQLFGRLAVVETHTFWYFGQSPILRSMEKAGLRNEDVQDPQCIKTYYQTTMMLVLHLLQWPATSCHGGWGAANCQYSQHEDTDYSGLWTIQDCVALFCTGMAQSLPIKKTAHPNSFRWQMECGKRASIFACIPILPVGSSNMFKQTTDCIMGKLKRRLKLVQKHERNHWHDWHMIIAGHFFRYGCHMSIRV